MLKWQGPRLVEEPRARVAGGARAAGRAQAPLAGRGLLAGRGPLTGPLVAGGRRQNASTSTQLAEIFRRTPSFVLPSNVSWPPVPLRFKVTGTFDRL